MCMDEFVKILYDFMGIYKIFWSQNSDYRYLPIFYRYLPIFTDILPIFFQKFMHKRACSTVAIFRWKNRFFPIFRRKIGDFTDFSPIFPMICLLCTGRKPIFRRNIGRKNRFFVPCINVNKYESVKASFNILKCKELHFSLKLIHISMI